MNRLAVLFPAHRLIDVEYPVHQMETDGEVGPVDRAPMSLCLYRDPKSHDVTTLELTPVAARILAEIERRTAPLADVVRNAAESHGVNIDVPFVEALSTLLADLIERGLLLASLADTEKA